MTRDDRFLVTIFMLGTLYSIIATGFNLWNHDTSWLVMNILLAVMNILNAWITLRRVTIEKRERRLAALIKRCS